MYVVNYNADVPIMLIDKHIGYDEEEGPGIDGALFQRELLDLDAYCVQNNKRSIEIWINSPGGIVSDGYAIYNAILATKTKVDTRCVGMACSIAAVIFQAGRQRAINDYGFLMYHNPFGGDSDEGLDAMQESIIKMISTRSGMSAEDVKKMMKATTFLTADEAVAKGLADTIIPSGTVNVKRKTPSPSNVKQHWREFTKILNNILKPSNMSLLKVTNKLNLNEAASEDNIVAAITEIQNKASKDEKEKNDLQTKLDKMEKDLKAKADEFDKMKGDYDKCKSDLEEMDKKTKEEEAKAKKEKAKNLIDGYHKGGRIKADAVNKWIAKAEADFDGTKELLEGISGSQKAVKFETEDKGGATGGSVYQKEISGGVSFDMAKISNRLDKNSKN